MSSEATIWQPTDPNYPVALQDKKARSLFPRIRAIGNLSFLERPLLGLFCSVKCPGDLILRTYDLVRALRDAGAPVVSGFHSPIEKDCLDLLLRGSQPVVICPARSIRNMRLGKDLKADIEKGRVLILSPFEDKVKRPTDQISATRNRFVGALAAAVFVSYAEPGGKTEELCDGILGSRKPLYTFESIYNKQLLQKGAIPVAPEKFSRWAVPLANGAMGARGCCSFDDK